MTFKMESSQSGSHVTTTIIQFNFHCNSSLNLALIWSLGFFFHLRTRFFLILYTQSLIVYATYLAGDLCTSRKNILLWYLSTDCPLIKAWGWIILGCHLVAKSNQSVGRNQTFSFVQLSALLSVLVRVYWLNDKGLTLAKLSILAKMY